MSIRPRQKPVTDTASEKTASLIVERKSLAELHDHPKNEEIRRHPEPGTPQWEVLKASLQHDYFDPVVWNKRNGRLVSGHLRKKLLLSMGFTHADVSVVDYDETTHLARMISANRGAGDDMVDGLHKALEGISKEDGFDFALTGFSFGDFENYFLENGEDTEDGDEELGLRTEDTGEGDNPYTTKVSSPAYTPKGEEAPPLAEMFSTEKRDVLLNDIASADIPDEIKGFLRAAANRHTVFRYDKIADYYAHAPAKVQRLMEASALVIIDFDKAIENGYVNLTERLQKLYGKNDKLLMKEGFGEDGYEGRKRERDASASETGVVMTRREQVKAIKERNADRGSEVEETEVPLRTDVSVAVRKRTK